MPKRDSVSTNGVREEFGLGDPTLDDPTLDDPTLDDLKEELLFSHPEITEVDGRGLVRRGETEKGPSLQSERIPSQSPAS